MSCSPRNRSIDGQQRLAVAVAGLPGRDAVERSPSRRAGATTTRVVAVSMARMAWRRPSWRHADRLQVAPVGRRCRPTRVIVRGSSPDPSIRTSSRSAGRASPSRSGHSTSVTPADWRSSIRPPGQGVGGIGEAVQVEVEERQAARVLGHEDERGRHDRLGHAERRPRSPWPGGSCRPRGRPTGRRGRRPRRPRPAPRPRRRRGRRDRGRSMVRLARSRRSSCERSRKSAEPLQVAERRRRSIAPSGSRTHGRPPGGRHR